MEHSLSKLLFAAQTWQTDAKVKQALSDALKGCDGTMAGVQETDYIQLCLEREGNHLLKNVP